MNVKNKNKFFNKVGGMALIDGVMMKSQTKIATAIRKQDDEIVVTETPIVESKKIYKILKKIPIIRGVFAFIDSMLTGMNELTRSAKELDYENENGESESLSDKEIAISFIIAMILAISLFVLIPNIITNFIFPIKVPENKVLYIITEAILKLVMFLTYIYAVSKLPEIKTLFMYHGAEHKSIACLENLDIVDAKHAMKCSRFHPRCGTSFIVLVLIISIFVSYFINTSNFILRIMYKVCLLPLIAGLSYEAITFSNKYDNILTKIIRFPGLLLQRITTSEPNEKQQEVALCALFASIEEYEYITIKNALTYFNKQYDIIANDALRIIANYLNEDKNKIYLDMDKKFLDYTSYVNIETRIKKYKLENIPLQYILKQQSFYGMDLYVEDGVLVPREDTEILVEEAINKIKENGFKTAIDMCCGSGCISIAIAKNTDLEKIYAVDISNKAEKVTLKNIDNLDARSVEFIKSNLFENLQNKKVDIIVSNPPYIETDVIKTLEKTVQNEPRLALDGGASGLEFYEKIAKEALNYLNDNGVLIFEIGYNQGEKVQKILKKYNEYSNIKVIKDLANNERVVICHFHKI